jgi:hypothetical protein
VEDDLLVSTAQHDSRHNGTSDEICPVCFWQDDAVDNQDTDVLGPNQVRLSTARQNYRTFGASDDRLRTFVRSPTTDELPPRPGHPLGENARFVGRHLANARAIERTATLG